MSPAAYSVLTAIGPDRVGIVEDLAELVAARDGNIEDSRMAVLGGEFAAIMLVAMPEGGLDDLEAALDRLGQGAGLRLELKRTTRHQAVAEGRPYLLETVSLDTPGIVKAVTSMLKRHRINIENLETETRPAPMTGAPIFHMRATVILDAGVSVSTLRLELADLEADRGWDISLKPLLPGRPE